VEHELEANGAHKIEIMDAPAVFAPSMSALLCNVLHRRGYVSSIPDLDYFITVDAVPIWEKLKPSRRQRINRCRRNGMTVVQLDPALYREAYEVIVQNRKAKDFPITMSLEAIQSMLEVFPDRLSFFGVLKDNVLIASSICVKVSSSVLYVFYWGDLPGYEPFSPVSLLAEFIYEYARVRGFNLIDFGTSTKDGIPIYGLINFKREIGCFPSLKPSYVRIIPSVLESV
jgi:lipid II:glycine glycyltransferase (peptidoglycan interpeptide bridge formation enzyme)